MAITVQMQFTSAVTEIYQDAFVGSSIENGTTVIQFDLRKHDLHQELGTKATLGWRKASYHVDVGLDHGAGHPSSSCLSQKGITH